MRKTIEISGIECNFKSSAAVPKMYRMKFGKDIFVDLSNLKKQLEVQNKMKDESGEEESLFPIDSLEMFENIAYIMHKHGDPAQPNDELEWLEQFETFDIYEVLPEILTMWEKENKQLSIPKKENEK